MKTTEKTETATKHMAIRVTPDVHTQVKVAAARAHVTSSKWVSRLILAELDMADRREKKA